MFGIIGESGYGKTIALKHYRNTHPNTVLVTAKPSMSAKAFWLEILVSLTKDEPGIAERVIKCNLNLYQILRRVSHECNARNNTLICIDEAGKLNDRMLRFLHEVRDETELKAGIILAGPSYFKANLLRWAQNNKPGMSEIFRRIQSWYILQPPNAREVRKICEVRGISDVATIKILTERCNDFGQLDNEIYEIIEDKII